MQTLKRPSTVLHCKTLAAQSDKCCFCFYCDKPYMKIKQHRRFSIQIMLRSQKWFLS